MVITTKSSLSFHFSDNKNVLLVLKQQKGALNLPARSSLKTPSLRARSLGWFSNRSGMSVDDGARKSNNWLDQWQCDEWGIGSRTLSFPRAFLSSADVPVLLLNQPIIFKTASKLRQKFSASIFCSYCITKCRKKETLTLELCNVRGCNHRYDQWKFNFQLKYTALHVSSWICP